MLKSYLFTFHSNKFGFLPNEYKQAIIVNAVPDSDAARKKFLEYTKAPTMSDFDYVYFEEITPDPDTI